VFHIPHEDHKHSFWLIKLQSLFLAAQESRIVQEAERIGPLPPRDTKSSRGSALKKRLRIKRAQQITALGRTETSQTLAKNYCIKC